MVWFVALCLQFLFLFKYENLLFVSISRQHNCVANWQKQLSVRHYEKKKTLQALRFNLISNYTESLPKGGLVGLKNALTVN